ncbi:flagellar biosynthetic protein FliO [Mesorhizobium sp. RP14(2022)]|uniref:Flagellar biosynthetic protein FliO n=1 Tax=Mesorhizobium liriopis TaxID=2953882 RepID=A0ABT1CB79_9HYPH|nr:flagellar biosynthetic protein FliO [Mesorhizobium liriopis]MCO6052084.1 flagellar biosynthetic protein FliO [Mesorhizobium liriopis]
MRSWLESLAGPTYVDAILWTLLALIGLVLVLGLVKLARNLNAGTFVQGGRNRKNRLAVMDATPVDSHRRLLLVRRDDVEHLILIGGPTDVVVEQNIRVAVQRRREPPRDEQIVQDEPEAERLSQQARPALTANAAPARIEEKPRPAATQQPTQKPEKPATAVTPRQIMESPRAPAAAQSQNGRTQRTEASSQPPSSPEQAPKPLQTFVPTRPEHSVARPTAALTSTETARPAQPSMPAAPVPATVQAPLEAAPQAGNENGAEDKTSLLDRATPSLDDEMTRLLGELTSRRRQ